MKKFIILVTIICSLQIHTTQAQQAFKVEVVGKGTPILFFPGFGCTSEVFAETVATLSKNYECHLFTFAGFGNVPPIELPWLPKIKEQVIEYVKNKQLSNSTIIGHSLGGTLGLWLAATETNLFKKIIVVDALPSTGALMVPNFNANTMVYDNPYSKQMLQMDSAAFRKMAVQMSAGMMLNKAKQTKVVDWMILADKNTYVYGYIDLLKLDLREDISKITIPVVILAATQPNKSIIEQTYNKQYTQLQNKTFHYANNAAHFVMYDQPEWFINKVQENL